MADIRISGPASGASSSGASKGNGESVTKRLQSELMQLMVGMRRDSNVIIMLCVIVVSMLLL